MAMLNNQRVYLQLIFKPTYNGGRTLVGTRWTGAPSNQHHSVRLAVVEPLWLRIFCPVGWKKWLSMFFVLLAYWCPIWIVYHWRFITGFPNSFQLHPLFIPAPEEIRTTAIPQNPSTWRALEHLAVLSLWGNLRRGDSDRQNTPAMPAMRVNFDFWEGSWMIYSNWISFG